MFVHLDLHVIRFISQPNVESGNSSELASVSSRDLYLDVLKVIELYYLLFSDAIETEAFDVSRILDDLDGLDLDRSNDLGDSEVILTALSVVRRGLVKNGVNIFGSKEEVIKLLINVIVHNEWEAAVKRSPLTKLMLLLSSPSMAVSRSARNLLVEAIDITGLFEGHQLVDHEMKLEQFIWLDLCRSPKAAVVIEILLRYAYNWTFDLCLIATNGVSTSSFDGFCGLAPISPVLCGGILLLSEDFSIVKTLMPTQIARALDDDGHVADETFFEKFRGSFRMYLSKLIEHVIVACSPQTRSGKGYISTLLQLNESITLRRNSDVFASVCRILLSMYARQFNFITQEIKPTYDWGALTSRTFVSFAADIRSFLSVTSVDLLRSPWGKIWKEVVIVSKVDMKNYSEVPLLISGHLEYELNEATESYSPESSIVQNVHLITKVLDDMFENITEASKVLFLTTSLVAKVFKNTDTSANCLSIVNNARLIECLMSADTALNSPFVQMFTEICYSPCAKKNPCHKLWSHIAEVFCNKFSSGDSTSDTMFKMIRKIQTFLQDPRIEQIILKHTLIDTNDASIFIISTSNKRNDGVLPLKAGAVVTSALFSSTINVLRSIAIRTFREYKIGEFNALSAVCFKIDDSNTIVAIHHPAYLYTSPSFLLDLSVADEFHPFILHFPRVAQVMNLLKPDFAPELFPSPLWKEIFSTPVSRVAVLSNECRSTTQCDWNPFLYLDALLSVDPLNNHTYIPLISSLLHNQDLSPKRFVVNVVRAIFNCHPDLRAAYFEYILLAPILTITSNFARESLIHIWCSAFVGIMRGIAADITGMVKEMRNHSDDPDSRSMLLSSLKHKFYIVKDILEISLRSDLTESLSSSRHELYDSLGLVVKSLLRYTIADPLVSDVIAFCTRASDREGTIGSFVMMHEDKGWNEPLYLLQLILGHSQFLPSLHALSIHILELLLTLVSHAIMKGAIFEQDDISFITKSIGVLYSYTMSKKDRIVFRIFELLHEHGYSVPLYLFLQTSGGSPMITPEWFLSVPSTQIIYSTLSNFPVCRTVHSLPFLFEYSSSRPTISADMLTRDRGECLRLWEYENSRETLEKKEDISTPFITFDHNFLFPADENVYDPAFWIPAVLYLLKKEMVSVRALANCGLLSLTLMTLSSDCCILRSYAQASLYFVYDYIQKQTSESDATFRERHQLIVLLDFVKNSGIDGRSKLPTILGLFLGYSALHLLQPQHDLYSKTNKYLLSRPMCDAKDIPLFELIMTDNLEENTFVNQRLLMIRYLRDGLRGKEDHLNMCRKHAYSRLMLVFPILAQDIRTGHAIIDLFDRALLLPFSFKYLLFRCSFLEWLRMMGSRRRNHNGNKDSYFSSAPSKILSRIICLLRRCIQVAFIIGSEIGGSIWRHIFLTIKHLAEDVIECPQGEPNYEYNRQLLLCMWDYSISIFSCTEKCTWQHFDADLISRLVPSMIEATSGVSGVEKSEHTLCALSLAYFNENSKAAADTFLESISSSFIDFYLTREKSDENVYIIGSVRHYHPDTLPQKIEDYYTFAGTVHIQANENRFPTDSETERILIWRAMQSTNLSVTQLPTSLGIQFMMPIVSKVIYTFLQNNIPEPRTLLAILRWTIVVAEIHINDIEATRDIREASIKESITMTLLDMCKLNSRDLSLIFGGICACIISMCADTIFPSLCNDCIGVKEVLSEAISLFNFGLNADSSSNDEESNRRAQSSHKIAITVVVMASSLISERDRSNIGSEDEENSERVVSIFRSLHTLISHYYRNYPICTPTDNLQIVFECDSDGFFEPTTRKRPLFYVNEPDDTIAGYGPMKLATKFQRTSKTHRVRFVGWTPTHHTLKRGIISRRGIRRRLRSI